MKTHNFSAGPCILPDVVLEEASEAVRHWHSSGLSLLEISHRDREFVDVMAEARALLLELLELNPDDFEALYLHGGASTQFLAVAYNFLRKRAAYVNTGTWSTKAMEEASSFGEVIEIASSRSSGFDCIPDISPLDSEKYDYLHLTSNNTIYGTQWKEFPSSSVPLVADMSSDLLSRRISAHAFDLIYAGAQKNIGPAGVTAVIVKKEWLDRQARKVPAMLDYRRHIESDGMYNTPPVFSTYVALLTLRWLKAQGGATQIERRNQKKAEFLYLEIDRNGLLQGIAQKEHRSMMNVTFRLADQSLEGKFDDLWKEAGFYGLKGHRSAGGYRASLYNALEIESVQALVEVLRLFEQKFG